MVNKGGYKILHNDNKADILNNNLEGNKMKTGEAEIMRLKYKYRKLILEGKIRLRHDDAAKLVGPDCAYHLYFTLETAGKDRNEDQ